MESAVFPRLLSKRLKGLQPRCSCVGARGAGSSHRPRGEVMRGLAMNDVQVTQSQGKPCPPVSAQSGPWALPPGSPTNLSKGLLHYGRGGLRGRKTAHEVSLWVYLFSFKCKLNWKCPQGHPRRLACQPIRLISALPCTLRAPDKWWQHLHRGGTGPQCLGHSRAWCSSGLLIRGGQATGMRRQTR